MMPHFSAHIEIDEFIHSLKIHWLPSICKQIPMAGDVLESKPCGFLYDKSLWKSYFIVHLDNGVLFSAKKKWAINTCKDKKET